MVLWFESNRSACACASGRLKKTERIRLLEENACSLNKLIKFWLEESTCPTLLTIVTAQNLEEKIYPPAAPKPAAIRHEKITLSRQIIFYSFLKNPQQRLHVFLTHFVSSSQDRVLDMKGVRFLKRVLNFLKQSANTEHPK